MGWQRGKLEDPHVYTKPAYPIREVPRREIPFRPPGTLPCAPDPLLLNQVKVKITPREFDIIKLLISEHLTNGQLAVRLGLEDGTVKNNLSRLYKRLKLEDWGEPRIRLVLWALQDGRFQ